MHGIGERQQDGISGRFYRDFLGVRYWWWPKRGVYVSQKGGKQRLLHREAFGSGGMEVIPVDGDWDNFDSGNWKLRVRNSGRIPHSDNEWQEFRGVRYYKRADGYFAKAYPRTEFIHRAVWTAERGEIPAGFHVHHVNHDRSDNRIENLELKSASDHSRQHAKSNPWVGSDAALAALDRAKEAAKAWHASEAGREWHREHAKRTLGKREKQPAICSECGKTHLTMFPTRSKFCGERCKRRSYQRRSSVGV